MLRAIDDATTDGEVSVASLDAHPRWDRLASTRDFSVRWSCLHCVPGDDRDIAWAVAVAGANRQADPMTEWWLDELVTAGPEHLDPGYVDGYDAKSQVDPDEDIEILTSLGFGRASTIVDVGAGTGVFAIAAAQAGGSVIAVDISPAMTTAIRQRADEQGLSNLTVVDAGFLSYDHIGDQVDFVYTRNALHQLPDFWKVVALRNIARILRPGGILQLRDLVFDMAPEQIEETIEAWMGRAVDDPSQGYTAGEFAEHVRSEHSTFTWLLESMLHRTGFEILDQEVRASVYAAYTCQLTASAEGTD